MASKGELALDMVKAVLQSSTISDMKPFSILRKKFDPSALAELVGDLGKGIKVSFKKAPQGTRDGDSVAFYDSFEDTIAVNFTEAFSIQLQALVVHEAVHALCDKNKYGMDIGASEAMAYIVQCQYAMLRFEEDGRRLGAGKFDGDDPRDALFAQGWEIARRLFIDFEKDELSAFSYFPMRKAINIHPDYKDKISIPAIYDGLKRWSK